MKVLVIGGGHAGIEAACAAARLGVPTVMVTLKKSKIGEMSCNPAIGGVGKGQLVKEVDILGGVMAEAIDRTGIQFRTLNSSRGASVKSSRAQADRFLYQKWIQNRVENYENLRVIEDEVVEIVVKRNSVFGVKLRQAGLVPVNALVVTTGTFLRGLMHCGEKMTEGGRFGEGASKSLSESLRNLGFELIRLKTGTPPRLLLSSIDFKKCEPLLPDKKIKPFSFWSDRVLLPQINCWITRTNSRVHDIIQANRHRSPIFNGQIQSIGPRYCPSIEDKVFRFSDKESHQIFLEPEGLDSELVYPNGISTSLPADVQEDFIRLIPGLEQVKIVRYGYAVEYDAIKPTQLKHTLESKFIENLFFAGQINGTSGYEEAAAQGIVAGINAALKVLEKGEFILGRHEAYTGVMIDDLVTFGVEEPYRMFTSRVEYRLSVREDNTFIRLGPRAIELGLLGDERYKNDKIRRLKKALDDYNKLIASASKITLPVEFLDQNDDETESRSQPIQRAVKLTLEQLAKRTDLQVDSETIREILELEPRVFEAIYNDLRLEGYLARHKNEVREAERLERVRIPPSFDYFAVPGLRAEFAEKLSRLKPETLGQASRVPGITPACLALLEIYIAKSVAAV